jgi:uncharacterized protein (DUF1800 family)
MTTARLSSVLAAILLSASATLPAQAIRRATPSPDTNREQTADQQVNQVLSRLTFGARPGDVQKVRAMGVDRWIEEQLQPKRVDDRAAETYLARFTTMQSTAAELIQEFPRPQQAQQQIRRDSANMTPEELRRATAEARQMQAQTQNALSEIQASRVARALLTERQLEEVMVDFWLNHFSVFQGKGQIRYYLPDYERAIRAHSLGKFRDLVEAVAKSPAMLFYLDNAQSGANPGEPTYAEVLQGPRTLRGGLGRTRLPTPQQQRRRPGLNENYARELLELHTLGVDGGYTQQDVINVARALTGWSVVPPGQQGSMAMMTNRPGLAGGERPGGFVFRPETHDAGPKKVLGVSLASGRGIEDGEQVLDIVARHPSTARFISTKLARRFVTDTPSVALVDRAAATFTRTNGDIREVVRTIVTSPEFFSQAAYRSKVKTPFELMVSTLRALNAVPDPTPRAARMLVQLGQPIYGKETPNGYPDFADQWMNTGAILSRINFGFAVAAGQVPGASLDLWPVAKEMRDAPRDKQVDAVIASLLGGSVSPDTRAILITGRNPFLDANPGADTTDILADTSSSGMMVTPPGAPARGRGRGRGLGAGRAGRPVELTGFAQVVGLALGSPEFQRR